MKLGILGASTLACILSWSAAQAAAHPPKSDAQAARAAPTLGAAPDVGLSEAAPAKRSAPAASCANNDPSNVTVASVVVVCGASGGSLANGADSGTYVYEGIQYANAPRWQPPVPLVPVAGAATNFGPICWQDANGRTNLPAMNEECLYLNVWTPQGAIKGSSLPVMVYIHGGAFLTGYGSSELFDGRALAHQGVVVVTLNYRLGALGFLASNQAKTAGWPLVASGNFGLMDQTAALKWVNSYISAFGGDPGKVTIFGESAGAMSVGLHVFDAQTYDTVTTSTGPMLPFRAAIMESNPMDDAYLTQAASYQVGGMVARYLCKESTLNTGTQVAPACAAGWWKNSAITPQAILAAQDNFLDQYVDPTCKWGSLCKTIRTKFTQDRLIGLRSLTFQPVIQDTAMSLSGQPFSGFASGATPLPVAVGVNKDEGVLFSALAAAAAVKILGGNPDTQPPASIYNSAVNDAFPTKINNQTAVKWLASTEPSLYDRTKLNKGVAYDKAGTALANVINDSSFDCGNVAAADAAVGKETSVYAYLFTQVPFFDLSQPGDNLACATANNVCHGSELPYVFNTLLYAKQFPIPNGVLSSGDQRLADTMTAGWAAFAQNPTGPGAFWTAYKSAGAPAVVLNQASFPVPPPAPPPPPTASLDTHGVCTVVWNKLNPL